MLVKSMPVLAELHDDHAGVSVVQVSVPVPLSWAELVAALWCALPLDEDPSRLPVGEVEAAVAYAVTFHGLHELQTQAGALAAHPPTDPAGRWFLGGCRVRAAELVTAWSSPSPAAGPVLAGAAA